MKLTLFANGRILASAGPVAISTVCAAFLFSAIEMNAQDHVEIKKNNSFDEPSLREMMKNDGLSEPVINKLIAQRKQLAASGRKVEWKNYKKTSNTPVPFASCSDIGVENGWGNWVGATGIGNTDNPPTTYTLTLDPPATPVSPRFNITNGTGVDPCTPGPNPGDPAIPVVAPGFGNASIQLGQPQTSGFLGGCGPGGADACVEQLTFQFSPTIQDTNFIYAFAAIFYDPVAGHQSLEKPYVDFVILDPNGDTIPCSMHIVSNPGMPGWYTANPSTAGYPDVYYQPWTTVGINLSAYVTTNLTIVITNADCTQGGHYAHSYWDFSCGINQAEYCTGQQLTLCAPLVNPFVSYTYQWYQNGNFLPGGNTSCIVTSPLPGDTFYVAVSQPSGCNFSLMYVPQDTCLTSGSGNESLDNISIHIFPNPSSGDLFIDFGNKNFEEAEIYLTDIIGEILITENKLGTGNLSIDVSALSSGVYFVRINTEAGSVTKKIIVAR